MAGTVTTTTAHAGETQYFKKAGGTVAYAGAISTGGPITQNFDYTMLAAFHGQYGSHIPASGLAASTGVRACRTQGNYAKLVAGKYIALGGNYTTTLAGLANTAIAFG